MPRNNYYACKHGSRAIRMRYEKKARLMVRARCLYTGEVCDYHHRTCVLTRPCIPDQTDAVDLIVAFKHFHDARTWDPLCDEYTQDHANYFNITDDMYSLNTVAVLPTDSICVDYYNPFDEI